MSPVLLLLLCGLCGLVSCSVTCPDGKIRCRDQETCCITEEGYKCCGYPEAVCCGDQAHCCPHEYICDTSTQMCERRPNTSPRLPLRLKPTPLREGQAPPPEDQAPPSKVQCDNYNYCPDGTTCCRQPTGKWGCCPVSPARCCLDGYHCCPWGYDCDPTFTRCIKQGVPHPFSSRRPSGGPAHTVEESQSFTALSVQSAEPRELAPPPEEQAPPSKVQCDNYNYCPDGTTCCRQPTGQWSCCPISPARCCLDGYHCCPWGYDCDPTFTRCIKQGVPYPFSSRRPSGGPAHTVEESQSFTALQPAQTIVTALVEEPAVQDSAVIRCDSQFFCPKGSSCCQNQSKQWSCCPYHLGVCCADGNHCCQYGYKCDSTSKMCQL